MPGFVAERCRWQMQRGEDGAAVKIWRNTAIFWAPQEGLRSNFKSFCPCQKQGIAFAIPCFLLCKRVVLSEARGACRASPPKRRRRRIQRGGDGAAVKIACRSKAKAILGTARGLTKQVQVLEAPAKKEQKMQVCVVS